ncbi:hypothetical protein CHI12_10140 [Terribacillus saccharophilus]|uniref:Flagellar hook-length control protein-like C-terminal domain-containing protein n=1 Tax=Terribacillus saccharophilus TaxID=361277 RepID=A0A268HCX8_9BACI|nr:hypothetical protein [Terribacillus saccharophilus]PAE07728.1 hypothetical protein CHI12_10140 [Terribacillus saccharophilus]
MHHLSIQSSQGIKQAQQPQEERNFRPGEVVTGKITKFFPDNKALLQIGAKQVIAELQASLTAGGTYWFEVKEGGERPLLQVLPQTAGKQADVSQLIELAGMKPNKMNTSLVEGLMKQQTAFTMPQLKQALNLLQQKELQPVEVRKQALQLMLQRQLPLTESVLQAITARQTQDMTASLRELTNTVPVGSDKATPLQQMLGKLAPAGPAVHEQQLVKQIIQEAQAGKQDMYQAIRPSLPAAVPSFTVWQREWLAYDKQMDVGRSVPQQLIQESGSSSNRTTGILPFSQALDSFISEMQLVGKQSPAAQESLQTTLSTVRQLLSMFPDRSLPHEIITGLRTALEPFQSAPMAQDIYSQLAKGNVDNQQLQAKSTELLQLLQVTQTNEQSKDGDFFKNLLQDIVRQTGFSYEHDLNDADATDLPLKGLLLQHAAQGSERAELSSQLLQQITGSQLLQVQDDKQMAYIQLQLSGAPFGFDKDILMELEGRKEADGQLSSDHCRILFYLHLPFLDDMVVDMYVQKKAVSLHIYTEEGKAEQVMRPLQQKLKSALDTSGYHLSSVKYTVSNNAKEASYVDTSLHAVHTEQKGVDYRI